MQVVGKRLTGKVDHRGPVQTVNVMKDLTSTAGRAPGLLPGARDSPTNAQPEQVTSAVNLFARLRIVKMINALIFSLSLVAQ